LSVNLNRQRYQWYKPSTKKPWIQGFPILLPRIARDAISLYVCLNGQPIELLASVSRRPHSFLSTFQPVRLSLWLQRGLRLHPSCFMYLQAIRRLPLS
jgi:hypothetical protein